MTALNLIRRMWEHAVWADDALWAAVVRHDGHDIWTEYLHILGAGEVWLARLEGRTSAAAVWPELDAPAAALLRATVADGYRRYLAHMTPEVLVVPIPYTNSAGKHFESTPADILTHVCLHAHYHRGKVNLLLRQRAVDPVPADFIAFARGAAAATTRVR